MNIQGVDYECPQPRATLERMISERPISFICRYLTPPGPQWPKALTASEAKDISSLDLHIVSIFETAADRARGGAAAGRTDGDIAVAAAQSVGQPQGTAIYFAVDFDFQESDTDAVAEYFDAAGKRIAGYKPGVYGSYAAVRAMSERKQVLYIWQTYAWSGGHIYSGTHLYQYANGETLAGVSVDYDRQLKPDCGWWRSSG